MTETKRLTDEELREIEQRAERATPGPWWQQSWKQPEPPAENAWEISDLLCYFDDEGKPRFWNWETDGEFVAHAREDIPRLIAEVRRLQELVVQYEALAFLSKKMAEGVE